MSVLELVQRIEIITAAIKDDPEVFLDGMSTVEILAYLTKRAKKE